MVSNIWSEGMKGRVEAWREENTPTGEGGDSKCTEYSEQHTSLFTVIVFFLVVSRVWDP